MRGTQKRKLEGSAFYYKLTGMKKEDERPFFEVSAPKGDGKGVVMLDDDREIEGNIVSIKGNIGWTKGEPPRKIYGVKLILEDRLIKEFYFVEFTLNNVGIGIVNSLAGVDGDVKHVNISLGVNKKGYKSAWVKVNEGDSKWALPWEEQVKMTRRIEDPKTKEWIKTDKSELQEYCLETLIPIIAGKIVKTDPVIDDEPDISSDEVKANIDLLDDGPTGPDPDKDPGPTKEPPTGPSKEPVVEDDIDELPF